jgi:cellulose biosynthesis protein BcsQ
MQPDVRELLRVIGVRGFTYREMRAGAAPAVLEAARRRARGELTIALHAPVAGAGTTAVCAGVACALSRRGWRAVAFDLDPQGDLAAHLTPGGGAACVPYAEARSAAADALAARSDAILVDAPARPSREVEQALSRADEVVLVLRADAASRAAVPAADALLARCGVGAWRRARARYLVNGFDGRDPAQRAALAGLRAALGDRLLPFTVQRDDAVREAIAARRRLEDVAPGSQVLRDLDALADALAPAPPRARAAGAAGEL